MYMIGIRNYCYECDYSLILYLKSNGLSGVSFSYNFWWANALTLFESYTLRNQNNATGTATKRIFVMLKEREDTYRCYIGEEPECGTYIRRGKLRISLFETKFQISVLNPLRAIWTIVLEELSMQSAATCFLCFVTVVRLDVEENYGVLSFRGRRMLTVAVCELL